MSPPMELRSYQSKAIEDTWERWGAGATRVPVVMATGLGKSVVFANVAKRFLLENPGKRVLTLAHTDELISQAAAHMRRTLSGVTVGVVKAAQNEAHARVIVSSRQTLASKKRRDQIRNVGLVIVDECHHATRTNTYGVILDHFGAFDGGARVLGLTATLARSDKQKLSAVWEECSTTVDILYGIKHGYLLDVSGRRVVVPDLNLGNVRKVAGDFRDDSLAEELERTFAPQIIAEAYVREAGARKGLAFWPLVQTAYHGAEAFNAAGIRSEVVHGGLAKEDRRAILRRLHAGETQVVHNCAVLTEGFDEPTVDVVVIARPTQSAPLYIQCVGRVLRPDLTVPAAQRPKALILDVVGASANHDLRSLIDLSPERPLKRLDNEELSLLELDDLAIQDEARAQTAAVFDDPTYEQYAGETAVVEFDPLHRGRVWGQTPEGTFYISAGTEQYLFLSESWAGDPGTYDIVWCSKLGPHTWPKVAGAQGLTDYVGLPLEEALLCAEDVALERGGYGTKTLTSRKAPWRKVPPTTNQLNAARAAGIKVPMKEGFTDLMVTPDTSAWTKGELSEALDAAKAARRIDPLVRVVKANNPR